MSVRIVLADDHEIVRNALRALLEGRESFEVVGEAADGERAIGLVAELGPEVRLVHGAADGLVGTFGSPQHMHYGPLLPGFQRHLGALLALEFGQSAEAPAT